jgi:hypothetical protein
MSSGRGVEADDTAGGGDAPGRNDDLLQRAWGRVARLGIDVTPSEDADRETEGDPERRASDIVEAFRALRTPRPFSPDSPAYRPRPTPALPPVAGPPAPPPGPGPAPAPDPALALPPEAPATWVDLAVLDLVALAVATGAYVDPWTWPALVTVAVVAGAATRSLVDHGPGSGALVRRAGQRVLAWLRPRSLITLPVVVARTLLLAVLLPGAIAAIGWTAAHGTSGAVAAARAGAWTSGFRTAAAIVCALLVAGIGAARPRRAVVVRRATARYGPTGTAAVAAAAVLLALMVVAAGPRLDGGRLAGDDGLGWAPPRLRDNVDRARDDVVTNELDAAAGCLASRQDIPWQVAYTGGNPVGERDVARLTTNRGPVDAGDAATAAVAVHNQLAPWVEELQVVVDDAVVLTVDRTELSHTRPVDAASAVADTGDAAIGFDRALALRCSAGPVL